MTENKVAKKSSRKKYVKEIEEELDDLDKKKNQFQSNENATKNKVEQIRFTVELIKYLTAELENAKAELALLKQSTKDKSQTDQTS